MMIYKRLLMAIMIIGVVTACSYERTNRVVKGFGEDGFNADQLQPSFEGDEMKEIREKERISEMAKKNHGLMHIHRYGPGFDVLLTLDAGDSDVSFSMALPKAKDAEDVKEGDEKLSDKKAEQHHEDLAETGEQIEADKANQFNESTKFVVAAQSLFYKKDYNKALDEVKKAIDLAPKSSQAHALKGSIYYKMGLRKDAEVSWKKALEIDPNMTQVQESLNKLGVQ